MKLKIGVSGCLVGEPCNFNGTDLKNQFVTELQSYSQIELVLFCPEDSVFGTPRPNLRIVGGDGFDVLDGNAVVVNENGLDVTEKQIEGANLFLKRLTAAKVKYAILMEGSPSCGSNLLLKEENWPAGGFKRGIGVTAALLRRNNISVFSSLDQRSIGDVLSEVLEDYEAPAGLKNLKDLPKFKDLF